MLTMIEKAASIPALGYDDPWRIRHDIRAKLQRQGRLLDLQQKPLGGSQG
jgi:hypothetical protein